MRTDITDTLILIQVKAFLAGQKASIESGIDGEPNEWLKGHKAAIDNTTNYIQQLQGLADNIKIEPWTNTYKEA